MTRLTPEEGFDVKVAVLAVLAILAAILFGTVLRAGEILVGSCRSPDPDVTHYRVYADGQLAASAAVDALVPVGDPKDCNGDGEIAEGEGAWGVLLEDVPGNCTTRSYTARNAIEFEPGRFSESIDSPAVATVGRPVVESIGATVGGIREVHGDNFVEGVEVRTIDGQVIPSTLTGCQDLEIQETPSRWIVVDTGLAPFVYEFPIAAPAAMTIR